MDGERWALYLAFGVESNDNTQILRASTQHRVSRINFSQNTEIAHAWAQYLAFGVKATPASAALRVGQYNVIQSVRPPKWGERKVGHDCRSQTNRGVSNCAKNRNINDLDFETSISLAALTTLGVGGSARLLVRPQTQNEIQRALDKAKLEGLEVLVLGGGSNLLVSDSGVNALVLMLQNQEIECVDRSDASVVLKVGAACVWDDFVKYCVANGFSGVECMSGIPGSMGAAPIQNIGAYGQEVAQVIESVRCVSKVDGTRHEYSNDACGFGYRTSHFKRGHLTQQIVTHVILRLSLGPADAPRYPQLIRACGVDCRDLRALREAVIRLRRQKSMIYDRQDPNHRSAGSFFVNPVVPAKAVSSVRAVLRQENLEHEKMPCFPQHDGRFKLSAAWLMERSGFKKGFGDGRVGLSTNHCLALVNRGGGTCEEILTLMVRVQAGVLSKFGVRLEPEPVCWLS